MILTGTGEVERLWEYLDRDDTENLFLNYEFDLNVNIVTKMSRYCLYKMPP